MNTKDDMTQRVRQGVTGLELDKLEQAARELLHGDNNRFGRTIAAGVFSAHCTPDLILRMVAVLRRVGADK